MVFSENMERMLEICVSLLDTNQYDKVIKCCDDYLKMKPKSGLAWYVKGIACLKKNDTVKADDCFKKGITLEPTEPANYYAVGMMRYNETKFEEALRLFQTSNILKLNVEYLFMMVLCNLMLKRAEDANRAMHAAMRLDKKETGKTIKRFFDNHYKNDKSVPAEDKKRLETEIENMMKSK